MLVIWGTQQFYRNEYIDKFGSQVIASEMLVQLNYIEISFIAGVFAAIPSSVAWFSGAAVVALASVLDVGLQAYHHRELVEAGYRASWKIKASRECLHQAVPEMMAKLESNLAWESFKNLPGQVTAKQVAFWLGRLVRGVGLLAPHVALGSVAKTAAATTGFLALIDAAVNTPSALQATLDEQAIAFAAQLQSEGVAVSPAEARQWLMTLQANAQARRCLSSMHAAVEELIPVIQTLQPGILR